jgi:hypothetical protein
LDERENKKLKVSTAAAACLKHSQTNQEEEEDISTSRNAWEDSLKESSAVFNCDTSLFDEDEEDNNKEVAATPIPSNPLASVEKSTSTERLVWKPPGASGLEDSFMRYLSAFQPTPLKDHFCCKEKNLAGNSMVTQLSETSVSSLSLESQRSIAPMGGAWPNMQQALDGFSAAIQRPKELVNAIFEDDAIVQGKRPSLDCNRITAAGISNVVVDDNFF